MHTGFLWEYLRERDYFEGPDIYGIIILRWIFRKWDGGHGLLISLRRWTLVIAVMNFRVP
jgi:hypothetical protein